ncbi:semaphorin-3A isoform X1 [Ornithorhynchus anatinus]|uniref:Semaphorin 3A n=2 Tax=Ornithorhynchus anatinus TaxID=9258 RepID=A0A6I8N3C8_ORNAN|nr:semaphorin-3A isoform X1 [Ornithorhynchus anatinus]
MGCLSRIAYLFWGVLLAARANCQNGKSNVPRLKLSYKEMLESNNVITFSGLANSSSYHTFLLDEERSRLYVGAKDHIFSFNLVNIKDFQKIVWPVSHARRDECKWAGKDILRECANFIKVLKAYNQTHLYACGTGAFHPICTYIEIGRHPEMYFSNNQPDCVAGVSGGKADKGKKNTEERMFPTLTNADNIFKLEDSHFENGRGKSPYDPKLLTASLLIDGELYSGTAADFMGRDFAIFRTLGHHHPIRTEQHDSRWLNDPRFISAHLIPESDNPEDDKVYFFFRENAIDGEHSGKATHARIGQICRNDFGGHRSLVNKWTTFLKARLICSVPGSNGIDTHFDELQDVFLMNSKDPKNPIVYGVFTTSSNIFKGSAVCMYSMSDVRRVFLGPYAHRDGPNYQWVPYQGRVPYPRPGTCPSKTFGGFDSTKDLPDDVITFARSHPAMYNPVFPINNRPIMIKTDVKYQFTQIVVDRVDAEDGQYDVMFIGTDVGTVLKVVSIPKETWHDLEEVLLEEMTVFREPTTISAMKISTKQQQLYIGSVTGVAQMPLHRCDIYGKACAECCLARDPYCAWDGASCSRYFPAAKRRTRRQDIRNGDPLTHCSDLQHHDSHFSHSLEEKIIYGVENSSTFLECSPKSQRALIHWQFQRQNEERKDEIRIDDHIIRTEQGLLLRSLQKKDSGIYLCHAVEHGFMQTLLKVTLEVIDTEHLEELLHKDDDGGENAKTKDISNSMTPNQKVWYRDFMQLINHPNLNTMDEFCEQVWKRDRKQRRQRPGNGQMNGNKWKHLQENKKGRNRRTHEFERAPRSV